MIDTEEKKKVSIIQSIKTNQWSNILLCIVSFFVGRVCLFESFYTLGIAYIGSVFFDKQMRRWSAILCMLGILSVGTISIDTVKYILILIVVTVLREIMSIFKLRFNIRNQFVIVGIALIGISAMNLGLQGITLYKIIVCGLETAVLFGIMGIFNLALSILYESKKMILSEYELAAVVFLMAISLCGMIDFYVTVPMVGHIYLKDVLVFILMLGMIYMGGMGSGVAVSIIISSVLVIIGYMPAGFVGIYVFAALVGGLFSRLERVGVVFATTLGLLLGFALFNNRIIDLPIMSAYLCASMITFIIPKTYFGMANWFGYGRTVDEAHHLLNVQAIMTDKLKKFSVAFERLAETFENIPLKNMELDQRQMNQIVEDTAESLCKDCAMCEFCWKDYLKDSYRSCYKMLGTLNKKGQILVGDIPPEFKKSCINAESFAYALGLKLDVFRQGCKWQNHFREARGLISEEFKGIASSVAKLSNNIEKDFYFNKEDEKSIKEALYGIGVRTKDIMVLENRGRKHEIHIYCYYKGESDFKEKVIEAAQKALEIELEILKYEYFLEDKYCYFQIGIKRQFAMTVSAQNKAKDNICGDVYSFMELKDGNYLVAVADGMGSGPIARAESESTIELLEDFLEAGFDSEVALKMVNSALVLKSDVECYTTMDMALFDMHTGIIEFLKMGASTSFIVRGNEIITVKASSLPIGMLDKLDIVSCKRQLKDGDIVIMVTDGILENQSDLLESESTFKHFILEAKSNSPEYLAKFLLNKSMNLLAGQDGDDMTVVVARVWKQY